VPPLTTTPPELAGVEVVPPVLAPPEAVTAPPWLPPELAPGEELSELQPTSARQASAKTPVKIRVSEAFMAETPPW
jgi:hypothetical protein